jgi:hypothetical protein
MAEASVEYRAKYLRILMERVRDDMYPSTTHMNLIERSLPAQWIPDYLDILFEKVENDANPSTTMMQRIAGLVERAR